MPGAVGVTSLVIQPKPPTLADSHPHELVVKLTVKLVSAFTYTHEK